MSPAPDWTRLQPHRPVGPGDGNYVDRPDAADIRIADWLLAGRSPVLVAGPVGIGKSTELAHAGELLEEHRVVALVQLDRLENMRSIEVHETLDLLGKQLVTAEGGIEARRRDTRAEDHLLAACREVKRHARTAPVFLIDGLEKCTDESFRQVLDALAVIENDAGLAVVVPWNAAYGPTAQSVIGPRERLVVIRPVEVEGRGSPGTRFLRQLAASRLALPPDTSVPSEFDEVLAQCAVWSEGIPRTFLQLLADAASYARVLRSGDWPLVEDVARAVAEQRDSFRRLMLPGDEAALRTVDGTDGREMELGTKLRLLSHGMLLEHLHQGAPILRPHPIVRQLLQGGAGG